MMYQPTHVLGVDQAARSGWGLCRVGGLCLESGVADTCGKREGVIMRALELAGGPQNLLFVFEDHTDIPLSNRAQWSREHGAPTRNAASLIGMGRALGRWDGLLDHYAHPEMLRIGVTSEAWRLRVLSCSNKPGTKELKERAKRWAQQRTGRSITDPDEAEAICIATWGAIDGLSVLANGRKQVRVRERVKRARKRQMPLFGGV